MKLIDKVFVNFTNHPSTNWSDEQVLASENFGRIVDISFPEVSEEGDEAYIAALAVEYVEKILQYQPEAVLCQGEFNLCYQVIKALRQQGITVVAACSKRIVQECGEKKTIVFRFNKYRSYV